MLETHVEAIQALIIESNSVRPVSSSPLSPVPFVCTVLSFPLRSTIVSLCWLDIMTARCSSKMNNGQVSMIDGWENDNCLKVRLIQAPLVSLVFFILGRP